MCRGISGQLDTEILKEDAKIENCYNMGNVYGIGIDVAGITAINIGGTIKIAIIQEVLLLKQELQEELYQNLLKLQMKDFQL